MGFQRIYNMEEYDRWVESEPKAATARSICRGSCAADICVRMRALPSCLSMRKVAPAFLRTSASSGLPVSTRISRRTGSFLLSFLYAGLAAGSALAARRAAVDPITGPALPPAQPHPPRATRSD